MKFGINLYLWADEMHDGLLPVLDAIDLEKLRDNLAHAFDAMMDRVSGIYKRYLKWISLAVGLAMAGLMNADTIKVGTSLWRDGSVRAQMVEVAGSFKANPAAGGSGAGLSDVEKAINQAQETLRPLPLGSVFGNHIPKLFTPFASGAAKG